ncbi:MAG: preprotein translocase subunit SecY [Clostridia bacterium]|nr:preprotein translocase subunit SecY [Clostridia bacterium]
MFRTLRNAWQITDLRKKILYTIFIILIFRLGSAIPVPFVDVVKLGAAMESGNSELMSYLTLMSGGGFSDASIFALSITPYINASIIIQLLTVAIPALERMAKEGEEGRKKMAQITRYTTVVLGLLLGVAYYFMVRNNYHALSSSATSGGFATWFCAITIILCFTAGSALMMWLGEQINERGIGNGISILLFAGIISRLPNALIMLYNMVSQGIDAINNGNNEGLTYLILVPVILIIFLAIIMLIVLITDAERRIPIQYSKRVVGRKIYGGNNTFIPIKVNMSGVMPIILAVSIISMPSILKQFFGWDADNSSWFFGLFRQTSWFYIIAYFLLIIGFAFFYVTIQYNPVEMANNLRKNSGAIPGYRPGKPTSDYIKKVISKITLIGALFLGVIALCPSLFGKFSGIYGLSIGGTSVMIVVGVALETMQQIESQMMMRHYKGFLD